MKEIREKLDNLLLKTDSVQKLAMLLEDYFYERTGDKDFNKNLVLATVVVERIRDLDKEVINIYDEIVKKGVKENI